MKTLMTIAITCWAVIVCGQASVKVEVSADTIAPGELVEVTYTIENGEGKFESPDLYGLPLVSGPNTSSSFTIMNGKKTSSQSFNYVFRATDQGDIVIPAANYLEGKDVQQLDAITIVVREWAKGNPSVSPGQPATTSKREKRKF